MGGVGGVRKELGKLAVIIGGEIWGSEYHSTRIWDGLEIIFLNGWEGYPLQRSLLG